jgi:hypothetical protein
VDIERELMTHLPLFILEQIFYLTLIMNSHKGKYLSTQDFAVIVLDFIWPSTSRSPIDHSLLPKHKAAAVLIHSSPITYSSTDGSNLILRSSGSKSIMVETNSLSALESRVSF